MLGLGAQSEGQKKLAELGPCLQTTHAVALTSHNPAQIKQENLYIQMNYKTLGNINATV